MNNETWVFGTDRSCDVRIDDEYASKRHCAVTRRPDGTVWLEDLGSANGTWIESKATGLVGLGGAQPGPVQIHPGTTIRIGRRCITWDQANALSREISPVSAASDEEGYVKLRIHRDAVWFDPNDVGERIVVRLTPEDAEDLLANLRTAISAIPTPPATLESR